MIGIGSAEIYIDVSSLPRDELEEYSRKLFDQWEAYADSHLVLSDYSLSLSVEDGSIKARGKVAVALSALYIGIGQYGSFVSGLQTLKSQVSDISDYLGQQAIAPFFGESVNPKVRKRGEAISSLEGLFKKVEAGEMSAEEALEKVEGILGNVDAVPGLYSDLKKSFDDIPQHPSEKQLELPLPQEMQPEIEEVSPEKKRTPRPRQPVVDHYRVVVWRDARDEFVNVKVSKV